MKILILLSLILSTNLFATCDDSSSVVKVIYQEHNPHRSTTEKDSSYDQYGIDYINYFLTATRDELTELKPKLKPTAQELLTKALKEINILERYNYAGNRNYVQYHVQQLYFILKHLFNNHKAYSYNGRKENATQVSHFIDEKSVLQSTKREAIKTCLYLDGITIPDGFMSIL